MGFLGTILNSDAVGTKVSVRHRQGGRSSEVVVKRGSTVLFCIHTGGRRAAASFMYYCNTNQKAAFCEHFPA